MLFLALATAFDKSAHEDGDSSLYAVYEGAEAMGPALVEFCSAVAVMNRCVTTRMRIRILARTSKAIAQDRCLFNAQ